MNQKFAYIFGGVTYSGQEIQTLYKEHYEEFKDLLKYTFIITNGEQRKGVALANYIAPKGFKL